MSSILLLALVLAAATAGELPGTPEGGPTATADGASECMHAAAAQLQRGAAVYAFNRTTCNGATGAGFAEARAAFPADHDDCIRCQWLCGSQENTTRPVSLVKRACAVISLP